MQFSPIFFIDKTKNVFKGFFVLLIFVNKNATIVANKPLDTIIIGKNAPIKFKLIAPVEIHAIKAMEKLEKIINELKSKGYVLNE